METEANGAAVVADADLAMAPAAWMINSPGPERLPGPIDGNARRPGTAVAVGNSGDSIQRPTGT
ncbi:hypothetical protein [Streptomyces sp. NPDC001781]